ncbi:MAG: hypothetical protein ACTHU0_29680 [Kofleriaceae bacterium]
MMTRRFGSLVVMASLGACGGASKRANGPDIGIRPVVALQSWYRSPVDCAQGPYELELPAGTTRWGQDFELRVRTPRRIALHAEMVADGAEVGRAEGVFDETGRQGGRPDNTRCIADARERLALGRAGGGRVDDPGSPGAPGGPGTPGAPLPPPPTAVAQLELDTSLVTSSTVVVRFHVRERPADGPLPRVRIRLWSVEPNDLAGVLFGVARIEWRPNVSDAEYAAFLAAEAERARARYRAAPPRRVETREVVAAPPRPVDPEAERKRREAELRRREAELRRHEAERNRRAVEAALEAERRQRRKEFCDAHPEDRDCWGAGGMRVHLDLELRRRQRDEYCAQHAEDARCWTSDEWRRRRSAWDQRLSTALAPPRPPDGPPPAPRAEEIPPRLSVHAEWRPGYWHWADGAWAWLAGMWRVPESDIVAEQTTRAPAPPPPPRTEEPPPRQIRAAVWIPGFWQWNGTTWVWIAGSWQLRPEARATWRAPEWRARGGVHVLIPGAWVSGGIGGRR